MFKKIELWIVALLCVIFFIVLIFYGAVLRHEFLGGPRFPILKKAAVFLAEIPYNLKPSVIKQKISRFVDPATDLELHGRHKNKPRFKKFIKNERDELLILSRYDGKLKRSITEIIDLNDFSVLHTFQPNINKINDKTDSSREEMVLLKHNNLNRYRMFNPLLTNEGELLFHSHKTPLVKIDFCGKLLWVNDEEVFHHSNNIDHEGNYWVPSQMFPFSLDKKLIGENFGNYSDDAIAKISKKGEILYQKSVTEILIENNYKSLIFGTDYKFFQDDPIHLNDIEPALNNSEFWKKGDLFLSLRNTSLILHFRPKTNQLINIIRGPFFHQHDVDIISNEEISIFNNNSINTTFGEHILESSEMIIYNFKTREFYKKFNDSMKKHSVKTLTNGLSEILDDGSAMIEESDHGRVLFFDKEGKLEWEFINKTDDNRIYLVSWSRMIKNKQLIKNIKEKITNTKCTN